MQLSFPTCPPQIRNSLESAARGKAAGVLSRIQFPNVTAGDPHEVYYVDPTDFVKDASLKAAKRVGWRMTHADANQSIAAEVDVASNADNVDVTSMNEGPFSAEPTLTVQGLQKSLAPGAFEVRMLRIPEIYLMAVWLHSDADDRVIPLPPGPTALVFGKEYSVNDLAAELAPTVQQLSSRAGDVDG